MTSEDQFVQVIKAHEGIIYKVASIYTRGQEDLNDLCQEIILQLWKAWGSFRGDAKLSTWLYRIAMNTAITRIRKEKHLGERVPLEASQFFQKVQTDPGLEERIALLYRHIDSLDKLDKGIVLLYLEDRKYQEIAEITGLSPSNVGTRLSRIKQKLRAQLVAKK